MFARSIIHISFGEDVSETKLKIFVRTDLEGITPLVEKEVTLAEAIFEVME
jgi:hypothetical protein